MEGNNIINNNIKKIKTSDIQISFKMLEKKRTA